MSYSAHLQKRFMAIFNTPDQSWCCQRHMKRPSWTSATQPVKTAKAIHNVFIAVVKAFACWTSICFPYQKMDFAPLLTFGSRMDVFSNSTSNKIQGNGKWICRIWWSQILLTHQHPRLVKLLASKPTTPPAPANILSSPKRTPVNSM